jgi:putative FmdB family regulatory protein
MPTYEFRCPSGHSFERFYRKIADAVSELECPECGKLAVRQLSGGAGLVFKGSGFYLTDYGRNAHRNGGAGTPSEKASSESSGEGKSESKAEAKTESKAAESKADAGSASASESKRTESKGDKSGGSSSTNKPESSSSPKKPGSSGGSNG